MLGGGWWEGNVNVLRNRAAEAFLRCQGAFFMACAGWRVRSYDDEMMRGWSLTRWGVMGACLALCGVLVPSCGPTIRPSFDSPEPAARNAAIVQAAGKDDVSATPGLIRMLRSDDPCTRLLAIETLEQMHGKTFGYDSGGAEWERTAAVRRWEAALQAGELSKIGTSGERVQSTVGLSVEGDRTK